MSNFDRTVSDNIAKLVAATDDATLVEIARLTGASIDHEELARIRKRIEARRSKR